MKSRTVSGEGFFAFSFMMKSTISCVYRPIPVKELEYILQSMPRVIIDLLSVQNLSLKGAKWQILENFNVLFVGYIHEQRFFKIWSSKMAYVLGFFAADGSMYVNPRGGKYISFYSNDREIIEKIKHCLSAKHKIGKRKVSKISSNFRYTLQIGSKQVYSDLIKLGLTSNKSTTLEFPKIPDEYLRDFVRGYFDGDGNILFKNYYRKDRKKFKYYFATKFICGSKIFLGCLREYLIWYANLSPGSLFVGERCFVLSFAMKDSKRLCEFMYEGVKNGLYLKRKYLIYKQAINIMGW
ncbi:hypothetical protein GF354_02315 [Candidatus Peregrinibacteria bacterium]|nr:hypothetical protein [Candidatus Peregrinibacteria bacterium]